MLSYVRDGRVHIVRYELHIIYIIIISAEDIKGAGTNKREEQEEAEQISITHCPSKQQQTAILIILFLSIHIITKPIIIFDWDWHNKKLESYHRVLKIFV